jgi:uncharacterized protein (DUF2336 family)
MVTATMELLADLDAAEGWPAERWAGILDRTAKLFLCRTGKLSAHQRDLFDHVFVRLIDRVDTESLTKFSQEFAQAKCPLPQVTRRLAFDENEPVALPILKSQGVTQELLLEVVQSRGPVHSLVIASRYAIDAQVTEALVQCEHASVHHALAENLGAKMSEAGWARLAELGDSDRKLAEKLARRSDVPEPLKRKINAKLEDARMRVLHARPRVMRDQIEDTIASNTATGGLPDPAPSELASAQAKMLELNRQGKLKDSTINRFAVDREYVQIAVALALLTGSPVDVIRSLTASEKIEGLVLACKAARLTWATTSTIVKNRPGLPPVSAGELEKAKETFQSISLSAAQLTVRF